MGVGSPRRRSIDRTGVDPVRGGRSLMTTIIVADWPVRARLLVEKLSGRALRLFRRGSAPAIQRGAVEGEFSFECALDADGAA